MLSECENSEVIQGRDCNDGTGQWQCTLIYDIFNVNPAGPNRSWINTSSRLRRIDVDSN